MIHQLIFVQETDKCPDSISSELSRFFNPLRHFCSSLHKTITKLFTNHSNYNFAPKCINSKLYWNQYHGYLYILIVIFIMHILYNILHGYSLNNGFDSMIYKCYLIFNSTNCVFTVTNIIIQFSLLLVNVLTYFEFHNVK